MKRLFRTLKTLIPKSIITIQPYLGLSLLLSFGWAAKYGRVVAIVWALVFSITLPTLFLRWAWESGVRRRVTALFATYVAILVGFAAIYYGTFLYDPHLYAFAPSIEEGRAYQEFTPQFESVKRLNEKLYLLAVLYSNLDKGMIALRDPMWGTPSPTAIESTANLYPLDDGYSVRFMDLVFQFAPAGTVYSYMLEFRKDGERTVFGGDDLFSSEVEAVRKIVQSKQEVEFRTSVQGLIRVVEIERDIAVTSLKNDIAGKPDWEFVDFAYFSSITMTTVGFGDIVPNSTTARLIVLLHSIISVFYIAFALAFLWPTKPD